MSSAGAGRKVFYFFPEGAYHRAIVEHAVDSEFEIYTLGAAAGIRLCAGYSNALVFINTEAPLRHELSELYAEMERLREELREREILPVYLSSGRPEKKTEGAAPLPADHGEEALRLPASPVKAAQRFAAFLEEKEARGQRRYVRFGANDRSISPLFIRAGKSEYRGALSDISSAAVSFSLEDGLLLAAGTRIDAFTLELDNEIRDLKGTVTLRRKNPDGTFLMVAMFDAPPAATRKALHQYIHRSLQKQFHERMKNC